VSEQEVKEAADKLNLSRAIVFRLISRYRQEQLTSALIPERPGRKPGSRILGTKREQLIDAAASWKEFLPLPLH